MPTLEAEHRPDVEQTPPLKESKTQGASQPTSAEQKNPIGDEIPPEFLKQKSWGERLNESWKNIINRIPGLKKKEVKKAIAEIQENGQEGTQENIDAKYVEKKILEIRQREEERLEARHGKGLIGKARMMLSETNIGRQVKIVSKLLVATSSLLAPTVLTGGVGVLAAPILYSLGLNTYIDTAIEAIQDIAVGNKRRLKVEIAREQLIRNSKSQLYDLIFERDSNQITEEEFAKKLTEIEKNIADAEENVINLENDTITRESKEKMIRSIGSFLTTIPIGILTGIPLGVQKFDPKSVGHLVEWTTKGFDFVYNASETMGKTGLSLVYGYTHALLGQGATEAAKAAANKGLANVGVGLGLAVVGLLTKTIRDIRQYTGRKKIDKETLSKIKVEDSEPEKPKGELSEKEKDELYKKWEKYSNKINEITNVFQNLRKEFQEKTGIDHFGYQLHDKEEIKKVDEMDNKYLNDFDNLEDIRRFLDALFIYFDDSPMYPNANKIKKALETDSLLGEIDYYHKKLTGQKETESSSANPKETEKSDEKEIQDLHSKIMDIVSFHEELTGKIQDKKIDPNRTVGISIKEIEQIVGGTLDVINKSLGGNFDPYNPKPGELETILNDKALVGRIDSIHANIKENEEAVLREESKTEEQKENELLDKHKDIVNFDKRLSEKIKQEGIDPNKFVGDITIEDIVEVIKEYFEEIKKKDYVVKDVLQDSTLVDRINLLHDNIKKYEDEIFKEKPESESESVKDKKEARPATSEDFKVTEGAKKPIGEKKLDTEPKLTQEEIDKLLSQYSVDGSETPKALLEKIQAGILESGAKLSNAEIDALLKAVDAKQKQPKAKEEQAKSENQAEKREKEINENWTKCLKKEKEIKEILSKLCGQLYEKYGLEPALSSLANFQNMEENDKLVADTILQMVKFQRHLYDTYGKDKSTFEDRERYFNGHDDIRKLDRMHELFTSGKLVVEPKAMVKKKPDTSQEKNKQSSQPEQEKPTVAGIKNVLDFLRLGIKHSAKKIIEIEEQGIKENDPDYKKYKDIQERLNKILSENDLLNRKDTKENINALLDNKSLVNELVKLYNELNATSES